MVAAQRTRLEVRAVAVQLPAEQAPALALVEAVLDRRRWLPWSAAAIMRKLCRTPF